MEDTSSKHLSSTVITNALNKTRTRRVQLAFLMAVTVAHFATGRFICRGGGWGGGDYSAIWDHHQSGGGGSAV